MSISKNYTRWIFGSTKEQFDELIKIFVHIHLDVSISSIVDGKGDGGIDLSIIESKKGRRYPIQLTVERNCSGKLKRDLKKVSKLIDEKDYSPIFYFFNSEGISQSKEEELIEFAHTEYEIELKIFDGDTLSGYLQHPKYSLVKEKLFDQMGGMLSKGDSMFDDFDKMKFDMLSYGEHSFELKNKFVEAFILYKVFSSDKGFVLLTDLISDLQTNFGNGINEGYCSRQCQKLQTEGKIKLTDDLVVKVILMPETRQTLSLLTNELNIQEGEFINEINKIAKEYGLSTFDSDLTQKIYEVLKASYVKDKKEIENSREFETNEFQELMDLRLFLKSHLVDEGQLSSIVEDIRALIRSNDFLQKICVGELFNELINSVEFDSYTKRTSKTVIIDTPVLIHLFCVLLNVEFESSNNRTIVASHLFKLIKQADSKFDFVTTERYLEELSSQIYSAIRLIPSIELGIFDILGGSNNSFYQLYKEMVTKSELKTTFAVFLEENGLRYKGLSDESIKKYTFEFVELTLQENGVDIFGTEAYSKDRKTKDKYIELKTELEIVYLNKSLVRSSRACINDALMLSLIYDEDLELIDPTLLTWDQSFNFFRKEYYRKHASSKYFHIFRPSKFLDHHALLNFKIDSDAITNDFISITQGDNEVNERMQNLGDILLKIIDMRTAEGTKLSTGLARIREENVFNLNAEPDVEKTVLIEHQPIDDLMYKFSSKLLSGKTNYTLDDFKKHLKVDSFIESFLALVTKSLDDFSVHNNFKLDLEKETEQLIKSLKQQN